MEPTILVIEFKVLTLSPGLTLSGEYATKKSLLYFKFECCSNKGIQYSSVHPGYVVDSYIIIVFFRENIYFKGDPYVKCKRYDRCDCRRKL